MMPKMLVKQKFRKIYKCGNYEKVWELEIAQVIVKIRINLFQLFMKCKKC